MFQAVSQKSLPAVHACMPTPTLRRSTGPRPLQCNPAASAAALILLATFLSACGDPAASADQTGDDGDTTAADGMSDADGSGEPVDAVPEVDTASDGSGQGGTDADTSDGSAGDARSDAEIPDADAPDALVDTDSDLPDADGLADTDPDADIDGTTPDTTDTSGPADALNDSSSDTGDVATDAPLSPPESCDPAGRCCGDDGVPLPATTTCRPTTGSCDRAERCNGYSGDCPRDLGVRNGSGCLEFGNDFTGFSGQCLNRRCFSAALGCNLASAGAEWLPCSAGDPCTTGYACQASEEAACVPGYNPFGTGSNGLRCDAFGQAGLCVDGACAAVTSLREFAWSAGPWTACAAGSQRRDLMCLDEAGIAVDRSLCNEAAPASTQTCVE